MDRAEELVSPVYASGAGEDEVVARWRQHYSDLDRARHRGAFAEEGMTQVCHSHDVDVEHVAVDDLTSL